MPPTAAGCAFEIGGGASSERLPIVFFEPFYRRVRHRVEDHPALATAIRRLVEIGLKAKGKP